MFLEMLLPTTIRCPPSVTFYLILNLKIRGPVDRRYLEAKLFHVKPTTSKMFFNFSNSYKLVPIFVSFQTISLPKLLHLFMFILKLNLRAFDLKILPRALYT